MTSWFPNVSVRMVFMTMASKTFSCSLGPTSWMEAAFFWKSNTHALALILIKAAQRVYDKQDHTSHPARHHTPHPAPLMMFFWQVAVGAHSSPEEASFPAQTQLMPYESPEWSSSSKSTQKWIKVRGQYVFFIIIFLFSKDTLKDIKQNTSSLHIIS